MENSNDGLLSSLFNDKNNLIKILFSAVILALGVNLFAIFLCNTLENNNTLIFTISIFLVLLIIIYTIILFYKRSTKNINIEAVICIDKQSKKILAIPRYTFSEELERNLNSVFIENEAFKKAWFNEIIPPDSDNPPQEKDVANNHEKSEISYFSIVKMENIDRPSLETNNAEKLLNEAIEYTLLEQLSLSLSSYFNNFSEEDKYIKTYTREDISQYLLENRILNLLSTPISDRPIFVKSGINLNPPKGELISIVGTDGTQYNKFDLILPKKSTIRRPKKGILEISNSSIHLQIQIDNKGFSANTPIFFETHYLGFQNPHSLITRGVNITISYSVKFSTMFSNKNKLYHGWVDYFSNGLKNFCSFEHFLKKIHWEECLTNIIVAKQKARKQKNAPNPQ